MWKKYKRKIYAALIIFALIFLGYQWRKSYQIEKANNAFDPIERKLYGGYFPWPLGSPSLYGRLDRANAQRLRENLNIENGGSVKKDNMKFMIFASENIFRVDYK